jgi:DNA modification methylase
MDKENIKIEFVDISSLIASDYNPRKWDEKQKKDLKESIMKFGTVDPIIANKNAERFNIVIGGHFRLEVCKELGHETVPVVYLDLTPEREKELNLRLNKNQGEFDMDLLSSFDESFLEGVGFDSEELDSIFEEDVNEEQFDLQKELDKLNIGEITVQKGDIYDLDGSRLCCGDSTIEADVLKLFGDSRAQMVMTDPPYILDYLKGKTRNGDPTIGFGAKKNRRYLETESIPDDFTELWMKNVSLIQDPNFSIIVYENWKNIRIIWGEMEKHWKVRNMIVWHLPNRNQGYAGSHKLFSKHDIAMVGTSGEREADLEPEDELVENEYETAMFAISGKPHWESYGKDKKYCPTDFIEHTSADEKSSGQGIIFGTKPVQILIPYIKILTRRNELVYEPFGGSGSTLIASTMLKRRCFIMEKSNVYAEVILDRWEKLTGKKRVKIS